MESYYLNSPPSNSVELLEPLLFGGISLKAAPLHGGWGEQIWSLAPGLKKVRNH